jgi:hypothetical protein
MGALMLMTILCFFIFISIAPLSSQMLSKYPTRNYDDPRLPSTATSIRNGSLQAQVGGDESQNACIYTSWRNLIPPLITVNDSASTRLRYDTLPRITTTPPLPFTNITLRSSFKGGSSFMSALVKSLYEGNETRQLWLNDARKRRQALGYNDKDHHEFLMVNVAFLRDPIDRFKSMYAQMLKFSNRKYHWYGDGDADWIDMAEGADRVRAFVGSVKRRFYNEHLLPQLWFLADTPYLPPNLAFVGLLDRLSDDWAFMATRLGIPNDIARDAQAFIDKMTNPKENRVAVRNMNDDENAKISLQRALYEEPDANAILLDICNIYRCDFSCFRDRLRAPQVCAEAWTKG